MRTAKTGVSKRLFYTLILNLLFSSWRQWKHYRSSPRLFIESKLKEHSWAPRKFVSDPNTLPPLYPLHLQESRHYQEPSFAIIPLVNPFPYLFISRISFAPYFLYRVWKKQSDFIPTSRFQGLFPYRLEDRIAPGTTFDLILMTSTDYVADTQRAYSHDIHKDTFWKTLHDR